MENEKWLKLHPNAKIALTIKPMIGVVIFSMFFIGPWIIMMLTGEIPTSLFLIVFVIILAVIFLTIIVWANMFYNRYKFCIGDDAVLINRGILWKRNVVIPYQRIQHTSVTRGPIDILLGLHILNLFTAGTGSVGARFGGAASAFAAEGSIPGLADPKPFQESIMSKVRTLRGDGLGVVPSAKPVTAPAAGAQSSVTVKSDTQEEVLLELRKIRQILEKRGDV
jgi:membrane protein YdbS with pleckstrin-like domain